MTVIETLCLAGDLILHATAQAAAHQDNMTHGSSSRAPTDPGSWTIVEQESKSAKLTFGRYIGAGRVGGVKGRILELRVRRCGGGWTHCGGAQGRGHRSVVRQKRAAGWRHLGSPDSEPDSRLPSVYPCDLGQYGAPRRGVLPAGVGPGGGSHAGHGR